MFKRAKKHFNETKKELKKVSWSSKKEVWTSTLLVIILSGVSAVFIGMVDKIFYQILFLILR